MQINSNYFKYRPLQQFQSRNPQRFQQNNQPQGVNDPEKYAQEYATKNNLSIEEAREQLKAQYGDPSQQQMQMQPQPQQQIGSLDNRNGSLIDAFPSMNFNQYSFGNINYNIPSRPQQNMNTANSYQQQFSPNNTNQLNAYQQPRPQIQGQNPFFFLG